MQSALAAALLSGSNLNTVVGAFQQAVLKAGGQISASSPQYKQLYSMLRAAGLTAQQAKNELKELQNTIDGLHGKSITVTTNLDTVYAQSGQPPTDVQRAPAYHGMAVGFAGGGMVGGPFGVDRVMAALSAGEAVLNARAVAAIGGPMSVHSLNTQPSHAVLTGSSGGGSGAISLTVKVDSYLDSSKVATGQRTDTLIYGRRNPTNNLSLRVR
jgi:hypothetical protein